MIRPDPGLPACVCQGTRQVQVFKRRLGQSFVGIMGAPGESDICTFGSERIPAREQIALAILCVAAPEPGHCGSVQ